MKSYLQSRFQVFNYPAYRYLSINTLMAMLGNGLFYIVTSWLVLAPGEGVLPVTILMLCFWLPILLLSPIAGVLADRYSRKSIIYWGTLLRAISILLFLGVLYRQPVDSLQIYVLAALQGLLGSSYAPAAMAFVRETVPHDELLSANATVDIAYEVGNLLGMASAGFIIAWAGTKGAFFINALPFLGAAFYIQRIHASQLINANVPKERSHGFFHDFIDGLRYVSKMKFLLMMYTLQLLILCVFFTAPIVITPFVKNVLHATVVEFGSVEACISIAAILGGILSPGIVKKLGLFPILLTEILCMVGCFLMMLVLNQVVLMAVACFVFGLSLSAWPLILTKAQSMTDNAYQGRVQSTFSSLAGLIVLILYIVLAVLGDQIGIRHVFWLEVLMSVIALILVLVYRQELK